MMAKLIAAIEIPERIADSLLGEVPLPPLGIAEDGSAVAGVVVVGLMDRAPLPRGWLDGCHFAARLVLTFIPSWSAGLGSQNLLGSSLAQSPLLDGCTS